MLCEKLVALVYAVNDVMVRWGRWRRFLHFCFEFSISLKVSFLSRFEKSRWDALVSCLKSKDRKQKMREETTFNACEIYRQKDRKTYTEITVIFSWKERRSLHLCIIISQLSLNSYHWLDPSEVYVCAQIILASHYGCNSMKDSWSTKRGSQPIYFSHLSRFPAKKEGK
jgi:hypothetical protein